MYEAFSQQRVDFENLMRANLFTKKVDGGEIFENTDQKVLIQNPFDEVQYSLLRRRLDNHQSIELVVTPIILSPEQAVEEQETETLQSIEKEGKNSLSKILKKAADIASFLFNPNISEHQKNVKIVGLHKCLQTIQILGKSCDEKDEVLNWISTFILQITKHDLPLTYYQIGKFRTKTELMAQIGVRDLPTVYNGVLESRNNDEVTLRMHQTHMRINVIAAEVEFALQKFDLI